MNKKQVNRAALSVFVLCVVALSAIVFSVVVRVVWCPQRNVVLTGEIVGKHTVIHGHETQYSPDYYDLVKIQDASGHIHTFEELQRESMTIPDAVAGKLNQFEVGDFVSVYQVNTWHNWWYEYEELKP